MLQSLPIRSSSEEQPRIKWDGRHVEEIREGLMELQGVIQAKSQYGIKILEEWYNTKDEKLLYLLEKGDEVKITYSEGAGKKGTYRNLETAQVISHPKVIPEEVTLTHEKPSATAKAPTLSRDIPGVTVGMAVNNAATSLDLKNEIPPDEWARIVVKRAKALLEEMQKEKLL